MSSWHPISVRQRSTTLAAVGVVVASAVAAGLVLALRGGGTEGSGEVARLFTTTRTATAPPGRSAGWIAYSMWPGIWLVRADGRDAHLIPGTGRLDQPEWSPDGTRLAAVEWGDPAMLDLAMGAGSAAWAPDGRSVAFEADWDGDYEIYVVRSDGTALRRVTSDPVQDTSPTWSPDGRWLAFERAPRTDSSPSKIVLVELATGAETAIVTERRMLEMVTLPAWQPSGG